MSLAKRTANNMNTSLDSENEVNLCTVMKEQK